MSVQAALVHHSFGTAVKTDSEVKEFQKVTTVHWLLNLAGSLN